MLVVYNYLCSLHQILDKELARSAHGHIFLYVTTQIDTPFIKANMKLEDDPRVVATLKAKVNSGAQGNVLPMRLF